MNITTFLTGVRSDLRDTAGDASETLFTDAELVGYTEDARTKLFLKVRDLLVDAFTADDASGSGLPVCEIPIVALTQVYEMSPKVIEVKELKLASQSLPLTHITLKELTEGIPDWRTRTGEPEYWCPELVTNSIVIIPAPASATTAYAVVSRFPFDDLAAATGTATPMDLGFRSEYHNDLKYWVLYRAFSKKDAQTDKPDLAELYRQKFETRCAQIREELTNRHQGNRLFVTSTMVV